MATVTLKIKIDIPGLRAETEKVLKELEGKLKAVGELQIDTGSAVNNINKVKRGVEDTEDAAHKTREAFAQWGMILAGFQAGLDTVRQIWNIISAPIDAAANLENYQTQFEVLLGSAAGAKNMIQELTELGARTPFTLNGLLESTKMLLNFGIEAENVIPYVTMLGDVAGGNEEKFQSLSLAFAQVQSTGRLMGQDLLQMINAGFNPLKIISDQTGESMGVLKKKMEEGAISADMVTEAFKVATSEGGQFHGMMEKQSQTFEGMKSTFVDTIDEMLRALGEDLLPTAKATLGGMTELLKFVIENFEEIVTIAKIAAAGIISYTVAVHGANIALKAYSLATRVATALTVGFSTAIKKNPIGLLVSILTTAIVTLGELTDWFGLAADSAEETNKKLQQQANEAASASLNISELRKEFEKLSDSKLTEALNEINKALAGTAISAQQREEFEAYKEAIKDVLADRKQKEIEFSKEVTQLRIEAIQDEQQKELAQLNFWFKEKSKEFAKSEEGMTALKSIYAQKRAEIEKKYLDKENEEKEKQIQKQYEIEELMIEATRTGMDKELALLNLEKEKRLRTVESGSAEEAALLQIFDNKRRDIEEKYTEKKRQEEEKRIADAKEAESNRLSMLRQANDAELTIRETLGASNISLIAQHYQQEKDLLQQALNSQLISHEDYAIQLKFLYADTFNALTQEYLRYTTLVVDTAFDTLTQKRQYSDAEVELARMQHEKELASLKQQLEEGEITQQEYRLRRQVAEEQMAEYNKRVEEDRQNFVEKLWARGTQFLIRELAKQLAEYTARKLAEVAIDTATEAEKTAVAEAGVLARLALYAAEIAKKLALAAASVLQAIAEGIASLFATFGPFAIPMIAGMSAAAIAAFNGVKKALGFKTGGYTGDKNEDEEAGVVHGQEWVFEAGVVKGQKKEFGILHDLLRKGITLSDIFNRAVEIAGPKIINPIDALSGLSLASPGVGSMQLDTSRIEEKLDRLHNRIDQLGKEGFNHKFEVDEIKEEIRGENIYRSFKLREKIENKKTAGG